MQIVYVCDWEEKLIIPSETELTASTCEDNVDISCGIGNELKIETISAKYGEHSKDKCPDGHLYQNMKCEIKDVTQYVAQRSVFFSTSSKGMGEIHILVSALVWS